MNLPHLPPILFAKEVLSHVEKRATVRCAFPFLPTLPMFVEAAAQSTSAFSDSDTPTKGFLVLIKDVSLHVKAHSLSCVIVLEVRLSLGNSSEFYFEVFDDEALGSKIASGSLMIVLEN